MKGYLEDDVFLNGETEDAPFDWRERPEDADADDEELEETPEDVLAVLGFDPKEIEEEEEQKE